MHTLVINAERSIDIRLHIRTLSKFKLSMFFSCLKRIVWVSSAPLSFWLSNCLKAYESLYAIVTLACSCSEVMEMDFVKVENGDVLFGCARWAVLASRLRGGTRLESSSFLSAHILWHAWLLDAFKRRDLHAGPSLVLIIVFGRSVLRNLNVEAAVLEVVLQAVVQRY